ncbi:CPBP family intramembrane glutamic endopeptidase [Bacillus bingmayongensis]|uniref:CPBP family intramembrane glutamic endopeptidase n=1 Tax=Bacillus bingmayongensis TaxID=1150157 RepID=UPI000318D400|nr:CPBP family intramembrane glutamic endopeptidase [Bacillus bingmayongensis]
MKNLYKRALKFSLCVLPIGIIAGMLIGCMMLNLKMGDQIVAQMPKETYILISGIQTGVLYTGIMGFFGYILADKVNLLKKLTFTKRSVLITLLISMIVALFLVLDYFTFAKVIPEVAVVYTRDNYSLLHLAASVIYGGVVEEIMMRLFFMSLAAFILWKLFARSKEKENIPVWVFVVANIVSSLLFAAGHIPATIMTFGGLNALILIRCFLLNGVPGILFGWLYQKLGLQYAIIAHALAHVITQFTFAYFLL